ncbi:hypothetical protein BDQ17DRAFT_126712 [Cyathus striatus]|nr:hypothetical protein BDQ17DRAFT_126712 [Cyathus striatus]
MKDLLPPSPSVAVANRNFSFIPSNLGSSVPSSNDAGREHPDFREPGFASSSNAALSSNIRTRAAQTKGPSHYWEAPLSSTTLPTVAPLDYPGLIESENAHSVLAHTINDLMSWLSTIESGFNNLLDSAMSTTIEEEQESTSGNEYNPENTIEALHV